MSLVEEGVLELTTPARALLGEDLPLVPDDVTVEHLMAHTSGIGDYLDENRAGQHVRLRADPTGAHPGHRGELSVGPRRLPRRLRGGERFAYNNGGYVLLAILAERASRTPTTTWSATAWSSPPA